MWAWPCNHLREHKLSRSIATLRKNTVVPVLFARLSEITQDINVWLTQRLPCLQHHAHDVLMNNHVVALTSYHSAIDVCLINCVRWTLPFNDHTTMFDKLFNPTLKIRTGVNVWRWKNWNYSTSTSMKTLKNGAKLLLLSQSNSNSRRDERSIIVELIGLTGQYE